MKYGRKKPKLVTLSILTMLTCLAWVGYSVYLVWIKKPEISINPEVMKPFSPTLDTETLHSLGDRVFVDENSQTFILQPEPSIKPENIEGELIIQGEETPTATPSSESAQTE